MSPMVELLVEKSGVQASNGRADARTATPKDMRNVFRCAGGLEESGWVECKAASAQSRMNAHDEISGTSPHRQRHSLSFTLA